MKQVQEYISFKNGSSVEKSFSMTKKRYIATSDDGNNYSTTQVGITQMEAENYTEVVRWFRKATENGYDNAQNKLVIRYDNDKDVEKDMFEAFKWFLKAMEQNHMNGQTNIIRYYYYEQGTETAQNKTIEWLVKSANHGYDTAKNWLLECFSEVV